MVERMMRQTIGNGSINAGDAVGVSKQHWFVAIVNNNLEKACGEKLNKLGYESYVPIQRETHHWRNGKVKTIYRVVLPAIVLVRATELERRKEVVTLPSIKRFMLDKALKGNEHYSAPIAIIPNNQIEQLRFMLENSATPVSIEAMPLHLGDRVRIIKGSLQGLEGNIVRCNGGETCIVIRLDCFGCAKMNVSLRDVERS